VYKEILKRTLPGIVFILFLIPVIGSSLLDLQQKKVNEENEIIKQEILAEQKVEQAAEEKIYLLGQFDPSQNADFAVVPAPYGISGYQMYLRKEALDGFLEMASAAEKDGVELKIASATRNFDYQKDLWNKKWEGATLVDGKNLAETIPDGLSRFKKILEYSAAPGTSRHHWGTEIDINAATPEYFETKQGEKVYDWLLKNAWEYGFCQPYTTKGTERTTGYSEEKWHWSYLPLSKTFTEEYKNLITDADITGFDGDQYAAQLDLINTYVLSINPDCL
jgi:LAS superfamily LD-carboxypeptidase LdcB